MKYSNSKWKMEFLWLDSNPWSLGNLKDQELAYCKTKNAWKKQGSAIFHHYKKVYFYSEWSCGSKHIFKSTVILWEVVKITTHFYLVNPWNLVICSETYNLCRTFWGTLNGSRKILMTQICSQGFIVQNNGTKISI